jgi:hypothetical protein
VTSATSSLALNGEDSVADANIVTRAAFDDLLAAAQEGAAWAFRELWESLSAAVAGYLRSRGAAEPEELTSEVFLAVFTQLPGFTGRPRQGRRGEEPRGRREGARPGPGSWVADG